MLTRQSDRPQCGALLPNLIRHFCRQARCKTCVRHACRRRSQIFALRCEAAANLRSWISFVAPLDATISFERWRRRLHDLVDYRRGIDRRWRPIGLIGRFDGGFVRGVARLANLGTDDFLELIGPCEIAPMDQFDAQAVARTLAAGPFIPLPGSTKAIFLTINPKTRQRGAYGRAAARVHREPMPIIF